MDRPPGFHDNPYVMETCSSLAIAGQAFGLQILFYVVDEPVPASDLESWFSLSVQYRPSLLSSEVDQVDFLVSLNEVVASLQYTSTSLRVIGVNIQGIISVVIYSLSF